METQWLPLTILGVSAALFVLWLAHLVMSSGKPVQTRWCPLQRRRVFPPKVIHGVTILAIGYVAYYLGWRLTTLNPAAPWLSWLLWGAEAYGFITFILFAVMTWQPVYPRPSPAPPGVSVDIMVPTRGEPLDILRATLVGCVAVQYPHRTYVLDDSGRDEVRELARRLGCEYIARPTHQGGKAGNLNYALKKTGGEFVVVLDADNIPLPGMLDQTLGHFADPRVAVVQGPQIFYNLDSFQHERCAWHEQRLFYNLIQPCKNYTDSAFWCGSPSVMRRSAVEAVGGVAEETVTEDLHTTLKLVQRGDRVLFTGEALASGIAPGSVEAYLSQRYRWAQGSLQVLRTKESPFRARHLTLPQRLNFIASTITYFDGLQLLVLMSIPVLTLLSGLLPLRVATTDLMVRLLPYLGLIFVAMVLMGRGTYDIVNVNRYGVLRSFTFVAALPTLLTGKVRRFTVTAKDAGEARPSWRFVMPHLVFGGVSVFAVAIGTYHLIQPGWYRLEPVALSLVIMWALLGMVLLGEGMERVTKTSRHSRYRFPAAVSVQWRKAGETEWHAGHTLNLSATNIALEHSGVALEPGERIQAVISNPLPHVQSGEVVLGGSDIHLSAAVVPSRTPQPGNADLSIESFGSVADTDNYIYLVHSASNLLQGEGIYGELEVERGVV